MAPPTTSSLSPLSTGRASPVSSDSFSALSPSTIAPSAGTFSPGLMRMRSPGRSSATTTSLVEPSSAMRWASSGMSAASSSSARDAPMTERISIQCPSSMMSMSVASSQKKVFAGSPVSRSTTAAE